MDGMTVFGPFSMLMASGLPYVLADHAAIVAILVGIVGVLILLWVTQPESREPVNSSRDGFGDIAGRFARLMVFAGLFGALMVGFGAQTVLPKGQMSTWIDMMAGLDRSPIVPVPTMMPTTDTSDGRMRDRIAPALGFRANGSVGAPPVRRDNAPSEEIHL